MKPYRTPRRQTPETLLVEAVFVTTQDIAARTLRGIVSAAVLLWTVAGVLVGLTCLAASLLWQCIDHRDRAVLVRTARSAPGLAYRGVVVAAALAWDVVCWVQRPLERAIRRIHEVLCDEIRRAEHRREQVLRGMRQSFRPTPEPDGEDYDDLYTEYGNPVGRRYAA